VWENNTRQEGEAPPTPTAARAIAQPQQGRTMQATNLGTLLLLLPVMLMLAGTGCATSGRYIALKEFSQPKPVADVSPLKGRTICVKAFFNRFNIDDKLPDKEVIEPANYQYVHLTREEAKLWSQEVNQRKKTSTKADWPQIGYVRNGFGAVMSKVYALNDPATWLTDTLKADLQNLGARVVDAPQEAEAEVSVGGAIKYFKIDMYMAYWADVIVETQLQAKSKPVQTRSVHTKAGQAAWSSSSFEYFQSLRQCQQKFSRTVIGDLEQLFKQ
jgi:hypothetical protein